MKKLMVAATVICIAAAVEAGAVSWTMGTALYNGYLNPSSEVSTTYEGFANQGGMLYIFNANSGFTSTGILKAIVDGSDISTLGAMDSSQHNGTKADGNILETDYNNFAPVRESGTKKYADYIFAMVVDDNVFVSDVYSTQISTTKDTVLKKDLQAASTQNMGDAAKGWTAAGWYTVTSPEPTSGLLLLLGVAGLALRRRRA